MNGANLRAGIHLRNCGLLLGVAALLGGCAYESRTMMEGRAAVPGPTMPVLPMTTKQRIGLSLGAGAANVETRTDRLTDSSLAPLSLSPRLVALGGQMQFRFRNAYWGGEFAAAKHGSDMASLMLMGMGGFNLAKPGWSLLAWGGLGVCAGDAHYTTQKTTVTTSAIDNHGDTDPTPQPVKTVTRQLHQAPDEWQLMASYGVAASVLDDQSISPYVAGRLMLGQQMGAEQDVEIENPVYFHRLLVDVGARYRVGKLLTFRGGIGTVSYLDHWFHGVDLTAHLGLSLDVLAPPAWWVRGTMAPEPAEVDEMVRRYEGRQVPEGSNEAP